MSFTEKTALITGAAVGIGRATALRLAEQGADLALLDVNAEKLEQVKAECARFGHKVQAYICDVGNEALVNDVAAKVLSHFGKIDIVVNNAALWREFAPFTELSTESWRTFLNVNLLGTVYVTKALLPQMLDRGYGRIVNVASVAGVYGNKKMSHYSATKGAVIAFTKALAKEVADRGVTVNAVSPGTVSDSSNEDIDAIKPNDMNYTGRTGSDRENADLICFLASNAAAYICGQNIQIDGCRRLL